MNIDILHRPTALENLLAGRIWPAGRRLPMHVLEKQTYEFFNGILSNSLSISVFFFINYHIACITVCAIVHHFF